MERLEWIDRAKGICIFAVMVQHAYTFILHTQSWVCDVVQSFYLNLFFLSSGFLCYRIIYRTRTTGQSFMFKDFNILVPFVVIGLFYASVPELQKGELPYHSIERLFCDGMNWGYWFLLCLFVLKLALVFSQYLCSKVHFKSDEYHFWCSTLLSFFVSSIFSMVLGNKTHVFCYWPYFISGLFFCHYKCVELLTKNKLITTLIVVATVFLFSVSNIGYVQKFGLGRLLPWCATFSMLFLCIRSNNHLFSKIGKCSLEIYCLHYFLLLLFNNSFGLFDVSILSAGGQLILSIFFASVLTLGSMYLSYLISLIPFLHRIIFLRDCCAPFGGNR